MTPKVAIIGAGHAGGMLALALRELGHTGSISMIGAERHLPYERPALSKGFLAGSEAAPVWIADVARWRDLDIEIILSNPATELDVERGALTLRDGATVDWEHAVFATGGTPRRLYAGTHPKVLPLRSLDDASAIRMAAATAETIVIIGGGVIGLEAAASLRGMGKAVTVIENAPRLMARNVPPEIAERMADIHRAHGVEVLLGASINGIDAAPRRPTLFLADGRERPADLIIEGIGIAPTCELARASGIACGDGICVDAEYRSSNPRVLAIGDVAQPPGGRQETWAHAGWSARAAAATIMGRAPESAFIPWFWTEQFGHQLHVAGRPGRADARRARGNATLYLADGVVVGAAAIDASRDFAQARRLINQPWREPDRIILSTGQAAS